MSTAAERAAAIASAAEGFEQFVGTVTAAGLERLVELELGSLDGFVARGDIYSRAVAPATILHVVSGNTPHAGIQSVLRGALLGARNLVKVAAGTGAELREFAQRINGVDTEVREDLPPEWLDVADAVVVFGNDDTVAGFRARVRHDQTFVAYGHRVSLAIVAEGASEGAAQAAARDVSLFDQQGCLSPHCIYAAGDARGFAARLAEEMAAFDSHTPRRELSLAESSELMHLRSSYAFRASGDSRVAVWQSEGNTHWTVIFEEEAQFAVSCLNRVVFVKPLPAGDSLADALAMVRDHLSTIALAPFTVRSAQQFAALGASRLCPLGQAQQPSLFWHHDGGQVLAPLVRWIDAG